MATQESTEAVTVNLTDLDDDLMKLWLNKLSITEQTAATRVCKRFNDAAYKLTTVMYANELPEDFRIKIISLMPELKKIHWFVKGCDGASGEELEAKTRTFLESVAKITPNIQRFIDLPGEYNYFFVRKCKEYHADYDGTKFKGLLEEEHFESLSKEYPDVKVRHRVSILDGTYAVQYPRATGERLSNPYLSALKIYTDLKNYDFCDTLTMTQNVTELGFTMPHITVKPNYSHIFDSVAKLPLKKFDFFSKATIDGKVFGWAKRDIDSFKALLLVASLVDVSLIMPVGHPTYKITMKCFLECPRNNFHHFSSASGCDQNVSPFLTKLPRSQLYPSMYLALQEDGEVNDNFPIAKFIQKFSPKYRKFEFKDHTVMMKMINSCLDLIKNQPKVNFSFCAKKDGSDFLFTFRPIQLENERIKFTAELSLRQYIKVYLLGHEYPKIDPCQLVVPIKKK